jgi:hypothetical protein
MKHAIAVDKIALFFWAILLNLVEDCPPRIMVMLGSLD